MSNMLSAMPQKNIKHGTRRGYKTHLYRQEVPCDVCRLANANYHAKYRKLHPEAEAVAHKKWRAKNPDAEAISAKQRRTNNPEPFRKESRESQHRRRAKKKGNIATPYTEAQVLEKYGTDCHICHEPIDLTAPRRTGRKGWERGLHIDHKIAIANGGADDLENARPSHGLCNMKKSSKSN